MNTFLKNDTITFILRIIWLYIIFGICRAIFFIFNSSIIETVTITDIWSIITGGIKFDSVSIFYINIPFLILSLIPLKSRSKKAYQNMLFWLFMTTNSLAILANMTDVFYYEFKLARLSADDLRYFGENNAGKLLISFLKDYWYGFLIYGIIIALMGFGYRKIPYFSTKLVKPVRYYVSSVATLLIALVISVVLIRGGNISSATFPISMSDATLYVKNPAHSSLILSNPFCLIRTINSKIKVTKYFDDSELNRLYPTSHLIKKESLKNNENGLKIDPSTNILILILESFGSAHIGVLNGENTPYTPFLDSLSRESMLMTNAYHNGIRSIDALPAIWASIPTFKKQFLSLPQSVAPLKALPSMTKEMGYTTSFMHGAVRESMSFVAFSKKNGVDITYSQEEYEAERGKGDFDGTWGIWDHKFLDFAAEKLINMKKPFFSTIFTLSSHAPFKVPEGYEDRVVKGNLPIDATISYTDGVLRDFFEKLKKEPFFENTLFIITADHSSVGDIEKFKKVPYSFSIPIMFYKPNSPDFKGEYRDVAAHIDIMPTVLGMLGYEKPYFSFGRNLFSDEVKERPFTLNYSGAFNIVTDSAAYIFDEHKILSTTDKQQREIEPKIFDRAKAFIQQYYTHISEMDYLPND